MMKRLRTFLAVAGLSTLMVTGAACGPATYAEVGVGATGTTMVPIGDGLWVVEDYPYPLFYANDYYWRLYDGYWWRSPYFGRGWNRVGYARVPTRLRAINRPYRYRNYRAVRARNRRGVIRRRARRDGIRERRARRARREAIRDRREARRYRRDIRRDRRYHRERSRRYRR